MSLLRHDSLDLGLVERDREQRGVRRNSLQRFELQRLRWAPARAVTVNSHESATFRGARRPLLRVGGLISYEATPAASFQPNPPPPQGRVG